MIYCIAGKNDIAVNILEYLLWAKKISRDNIVVCCNRNEIGVNSWQRSLRFAANKLGVKEVTLEDVYSISDLIFLSLEFDKIIKPEKFVTNKLFNIHFSLLPAYKGMYPIVFSILNNDKYGGVTFHYIDNGIDTGAIIAQQSFGLNFDDTARDIYQKSISCGTALVKACIDKYLPIDFNCVAVFQDYNASSYNSKKSIDYTNLRIDLNNTAVSIHNQIRAFNFREYQLPQIFGRKIRFCEITHNHTTVKAGTIIWQNSDCFMLGTIDYDIVVYFDQFELVCDVCHRGDIQKLKEIVGLHYYVNEKDQYGWTPIIIATYNGYYDIVMYLITRGADIYVRDNNGTNLLMYAKDAFLRTGDSRLFSYFYQKHISLDSVDYEYKSLRDYCAEQNINQIGDIMI